MQDTLLDSARPVMFHLLVKRWRAYLGVTQKEFANLWGVSASMVQKIETEDYSVGQLSFERLEALRALLKLSPGEFYSILTGEEGLE
jgi:transcriptional regulator with XRE-family HTH domain